ncbi:MAG: FtsW/RodA/SpoVE family cell cycle protein [Defluviitaleaceae bacterium]|nr:FtsW/RodA/SpoVE family cell cycle protein [Defluviitaleaceae bacterium]
MLSENLKEKRAKYDFFDGVVLVAVLILSALGILLVFSITGTSIFNNRTGDRLGYMIHSTTGVVLGVIAMIVMALVPNKLFREKLGLPILLGTLVIFVMTPIFGQGVPTSPEATRWLRIPGVITFQAVDLARIGFVLSLPWLIKVLIDKRRYYSKKIGSAYLIPLAYVFLCTLLVIAQPDLGSAMVIFTIGIVVFLSSGLHLKQLTFFLLVAVAALVGVVLVGVDLWEYQIDRIDVWRDPFNHPNGHQIVMGFVSIALGGWWGEGIGRSTTALGFAIEPHTDLIITILSEELGVITVFMVMGLYFLIALKCFLTALKSRDVFSALVCIGIGTFFLAQPFVNLGGVSGVIPLSGVTLPLISYGMTSQLSTFVLIGLYFNMRRYILIDVEKHKAAKKKKETRHLYLLPRAN